MTVRPGPARLLVITYSYPPLASVGSNRWSAMVRHMREMGHDVVVITTSAAGRVEGEERVIRTRDVFSVPAVRRALGAPALPGPSYPARADFPPTTHQRIAVPDPKILGWAPGAYAAARPLLRDGSVDCLITTSPFESTHLVGLALGPRRPSWLVDLRDGWTFEPWRSPLPLSAQRRMDAWLERRVLTAADGVTAVPRAVVADVRRRFGRAAQHISDGWDPALERDLPAVKPPQGSAANPSPGCISLVYTGTLWRADGQDPSPLLHAIRRLRVEERPVGQRLRLIVAGALSPIEARRLDQFGLDSAIRHLGYLSRSEAVMLQRSADGLVVLGSSHRDVVTGKLFEYLASGRPIIVLSDRNEAATIVRETRTGVAVAPEDQSAIVQVLRDLVRGQLAAFYRPRGLAAYRYPAPAETMIEAIYAAMARGAERLAGRRSARACAPRAPT